ncbi:kinase-like domain-containing protein [Chytriomyces sp. MP71]|nr:kinase-like domain-containing protein [Chytriomyces sp. MP71]
MDIVCNPGVEVPRSELSVQTNIGGELFEHILTSRCLSEEESRKMFAQIISAVGFIHNIGIVHRDLKLENILLDEERNVLITDFGFANKSQGSEGLLKTSCGSPCYAAPELVTSDSGYVGEAADIWSCGVILFSMIAGYLPYDDDPENPDGDNINLLYNYIMETKLVYPDYVPKDCQHLINRILVPNPQYRAGIQEIMNHHWLKPVRYIFEEEFERRKVCWRRRFEVFMGCQHFLAPDHGRHRSNWARILVSNSVTAKQRSYKRLECGVLRRLVRWLHCRLSRGLYSLSTTATSVSRPIE